MSFRNISAWCIRNPVPPIVLFIALLLTGIYAFATMEITNNPDIDFPAANVTISQPGAAPSEMVNQVTQKVEAAVRGVDGVDEINSDVREGNSNTFIQFKIGTPTDRAVNDVKAAIDQIRGDLPDGILEPQVSRVNIGGDGFVFIAVEATDMSLEELSWYVDSLVSRRLLAQPGVAQVSREGGVDRQIRVILDPAALQSQGITAAQVNQQLRQINLDAPGGRAEIAGSEQTVRVLGNAKSAAALADTQIALPGGRFVRLGDIAQVRDSSAEPRSATELGGRPVVSFNVARAKGASDVTAYENTWNELRKIEKEDPRVRFVEINNSVDYTKGQYSSSMHALIEGAVLAVLVVFLFLRDVRATVISAIAIPLSAIPAFWFMDLMSINLNFLSLLALALVAGVLVDDAIVEIENIVRHMRMGKSAYQASIDAADEIGLAVLATTMSIVAVFLPVALMPGISGQFFRNFGYTVVLAVLMSLLVARMITPLMAAYFLRSGGVQEHASGKWMERYLNALRWTIDSRKAVAARDSAGGFLGRRWARIHDHRIWMVGVGFLILIATGIGISTLSMTFQPQLDLPNSTIRIGLAPGTTLDQTKDVTRRVTDIVLQNPNVENVFQRSFTSSAFINVVYKKDRTAKSYEIERQITPKLAEIADARVNFMSQGGGGPGSGGRPITLYLGGDDPAKLATAAAKLSEEMQTVPMLVAPRVQGDVVRPEIRIKPRFDLAADLGVSTSALAQTIRIATIGDIDQNSARFSLSDRQVPIIVSLDKSERRDIATLENLPVPTASGGSVPLKSVAEISFGSGPVTVNRTNQMYRIAVGADLTPGTVTGDAWKQIDQLPTMKNLPAGVQRLTLGDQKWQGELITNFILAVFAGIALVFAVLVLLYRRFLAPLVNLGSLLLAPLGAVIALHVSGQPLSLPVFIGLLMLFGIVAKNSILLVDFAVEMMDHGMTKDEAIVEAGHKRAQPIVMTTVAMVAGMIPIALSLTGDGSWRAPMGVTVIGGLLMSTFLTLLLVPAYFSLAIDIESWIGRKLGRSLRATAHEVPEAVDEPRAPGRPGIPQPAE
ncbi:efflux RND transporter permease subunit [Sphingomonas astaxanthinifaciens]|uniref:Acriflavine resistance protein B n=1 Tax=Sphingomonas astaxanthinifaciens DSM 22298 TaxID=1123267 RepID=A0ABQ5Z5A9_9SPHN|nr:efflux RND transporter permease subunit [Sphingomonas astaxanthinifaciens]GLR47149.1 acriflavine resistance protein B [Sphingomonas astaxanthinifaciens DSM 22298]